MVFGHFEAEFGLFILFGGAEQARKEVGAFGGGAEEGVEAFEGEAVGVVALEDGAQHTGDVFAVDVAEEADDFAAHGDGDGGFAGALGDFAEDLGKGAGLVEASVEDIELEEQLGAALEAAGVFEEVDGFVGLVEGPREECAVA